MGLSPSSKYAMFGGRFEVEREVGRGGVGIVYRAIDRETGRPVALKVIAVSDVDPAEEARFAREGETLKGLDHPNIVKLVQYGSEESTPYVAMEWLEGEDLAARQKRAPLRLGEALEVSRQIALALDTAHRAGIVHRDVKPSNVFILSGAAGETPRAKLVDFGVALQDDARVTRTGVVIGTPAYMAPEQAKAEGIPDARADIYSLGATLFELITGRPPHVGATAIATLARLVTTEAPRLLELISEVPPALDRLVASMLASEREKRPGSALEVAHALAQIAADETTRDVSLPRTARRVEAAEVTQGTRLMTSIVALAVGERRFDLVRELRARGADAAVLGKDALVAHLGARRALGGEAIRALELARWIAEGGGQVGVATGRSRVDLTRPVGDVVDRAAALAHAAGAEEVLADTATTELSRTRFGFQMRDDHSLLVGPPLAAKREGAGGAAAFVGRDAELAHIIAAFERCVDDQTPVVVSVSGPPGIGKSRLGREVLVRLRAHASQPKISVVGSEPFGQAHALGTATDVVRALLGAPKGTSHTAALTALAALSPATEPDRSPLGPDGRPLLARLIADEPLPEDLDAAGARDELWLAMTDLVLRVTGRDPSVIVLEDLQWADPESIAWIEHVLGRAAGRPLFVLSLVRPEFFRDKGGAPRFSGRDHLPLDLKPLSRRSSRAIASAILGDSGAPDVLERIAEQAAGSPLFAEELARLTALGQDAQFAPTIEAAIQVSLDALDQPCRDAALRLSIFGLSGWDRGLVALGVRDPEGALHQMSLADLVTPRPESRFAGTREWAFKHALVRDVAYALLGDAQKKSLHALAGAWLAEQGDDAATVANHLDIGGRGTEAAVYWERAARRALLTNALSDAVRMAETALLHAPDAPTAFARAQLLDEAFGRLDPRAADRETAVQALLASAYDEASRLRAEGARARFDYACGTGMQLKARLVSVRENARRLGLVDEQVRCTAILAMRAAFEGELDEATREADYLFQMAREQKILAAAVDAWQCLAVVRQTRGELGPALDARRAAALAASQAGLREREAMLSVNLGFALTTIGARADARQAIETGLSIAHAIGSPGAIRHGRMNLLGWTATFGPDPVLDAELTEARADADATTLGSWVTPDRATLGVLFYRGCEWLRDAGPGSALKARELLRTAAGAYRTSGNRDVLPVALARWAEAERRNGAHPQALALAEEAADLVEKGAPSLLNESPIFLALHDARDETGDASGAAVAIRRGMAPLVRRLRGLAGSSYAHTFLTALSDNELLIRRARSLGLLPAEVADTLAREPV